MGGLFILTIWNSGSGRDPDHMPLTTTEAEKEQNRIRARAWYAANRERANEAARLRRLANPEDNKRRCAAWRKANPEKFRESKKRCYERRREYYIAKAAEFLKTDKRKIWAREYARRRYSDPQTRIYQGCLATLSQMLRGRLNGSRHGRYVAAVGCSPAQLRAHLGGQFRPGMTWDNRGRRRGSWQIDHIRPASSFDLTDEVQFKAFSHYTNLQPLWADENNRKREGAR